MSQAVSSDLVLGQFSLVWDGDLLSINKAYFNGPGGRRVLTASGKALKARIAEKIARDLPITWGLAVQAVYARRARAELDLHLFCPIYATTWTEGKHKRGDETRAMCPYKKMDASNYIKIVEDAIVVATGIDDSANCRVQISKTDCALSFLSISYRVVKDDGE